MYVGPFVCSIYICSSGFRVQYLIATQPMPTFYKTCLGVITALKHFWQLESKEGRALFLTFRHLRMAAFVFFFMPGKKYDIRVSEWME